MKYFISAGHSSDSNGANFKEEFFEHREAKVWQFIICELLDVYPVPIGDLKSKVEYINKHATKDSVAIEIHFNSAMKDGEHIGKGCETLYHPKSVSGKNLATKIHTELLRSFSPDRGIKEGYYQMNPSKPVDYFLAKTKCPAIIIEPDFIHRSEIITYARGACCRNIARALTCS